jgi:hypothetical protein
MTMTTISSTIKPNVQTDLILSGRFYKHFTIATNIVKVTPLFEASL